MPVAATLGVVSAATGTLITATGNLYLRKSALEDEAELPLLRRRYWMTGTCLLVVPLTVFNALACALTPLSLLAPCAGLTTVWSVWLASCGCLGIVEPFSRYDVACSLLVLGVTLVTSSRGHKQEEHTIDDLTDVVGSARFIGAWLIVVVFGASLGPVKARMPSSSAFVLTAFFGAMCAAVSQSFLKFVSLAIHALLGGEHVPPLVLAVGLIGLATSPPLNLYLLGETIASGTVLVAVGTYEALVIVLTAVWGILFFDELEHYRTQQAVLLIVGLLVTLMGVAALNCKFGQPEGALSPRHAARVAPTDQAAATLMRSLDLDDDETPGDTPAPG